MPVDVLYTSLQGALYQDNSTGNYWWVRDGVRYGPYSSLILCLSDASQPLTPTLPACRPPREPRCPQCRSENVAWAYGPGMAEGECSVCAHIWAY